MLLPLLFLAFQSAPAEPERQIHWQRSLEDAQCQVARDGRPLLVVINADGESASERIVSERYRDPRFVALTRSFHCVVGSYFRHTPRDHDSQGRRIECPRLGEVTCGEHIALEPVLHDLYLLGERIVVDDGVVQRISPRHALVLADGSKEFDLFLLFDFRTLDERLAQAAARWPESSADADSSASDASIHRVRLSREELAAHAEPQAWLEGALARPSIDRGIADELWRVLPRLDTRDPAVPSQLFDLGARSGTTATIASALRSLALDWHAHPELTVPGIVALGWDDVSLRTLALSHAVLGSELHCAAVRRALDARVGPSAWPPAFDVFARGLPQREAQRESKRKPPLPPAEQLELELEQTDDRLSRDRSSATAQLELGRAALMLARSRMQSGGSGIELLLQDAKLALAKAQESRPEDVLLMLDRARVANYLQEFEEQERLALAALATRKVDLAGGPLDDDMTEAARWLGDACARLLGARAAGDVRIAANGMRNGALALSQAAFGPEHDATDWLSLASFYGALGRQRERVELAYAGLFEYPVDVALRNELAAACWALGEPQLLVERSEALARAHALQGWPELDWYVGYAHVLHAEWQRRGSRSDEAVASYERAEAAFRRASDSPFRESCDHYLALCALGRGFAHLAADRRPEAARCLTEAVRRRPEIFGVRDGLDREGVDLVDAVLEWRTSGTSPVNARELVEDLAREWKGESARSELGASRWVSAIADAELREALRAFGRGAPSEGFAYLSVALDAAVRADSIEASETNARARAQVLTIWAERELALGEAGARESADSKLRTAAELLGWPEAPEEPAESLAARLRASLGPARPVFRPGR